MNFHIFIYIDCKKNILTAMSAAPALVYSQPTQAHIPKNGPKIRLRSSNMKNNRQFNKSFVISFYYGICSCSIFGFINKK